MRGNGYFSEKLRNLKNTHTTYQRKIKRCRKRGDKKRLQSLIHIFKEKMHAARDQFFSPTLSSFMTDQPKKFWRYLSKDKNSITEIKTPGGTTDDPAVFAEGFNTLFQSVFMLTASHVQMPSYALVKQMPEVHLTKYRILSLLCKIDTKKSPGPALAFKPAWNQATPFYHHAANGNFQRLFQHFEQPKTTRCSLFRHF